MTLLELVAALSDLVEQGKGDYEVEIANQADDHCNWSAGLPTVNEESRVVVL